MNPIGQLAGVGPQVALVTTYGSHPIVVDMRGHATGFPLSRSLEIKNGDKTTVEKLFDSSATAWPPASWIRRTSIRTTHKTKRAR